MSDLDKFQANKTFFGFKLQLNETLQILQFYKTNELSVKKNKHYQGCLKKSISWHILREEPV